MLKTPNALTPARILSIDRPTGCVVPKKPNAGSVQIEIPQYLQKTISLEERLAIRIELSRNIIDLKDKLHVSKYSPTTKSPFLLEEADLLRDEADGIQARIDKIDGSVCANPNADSVFLEARRMNAMLRVMILGLGDK